MIIDKQGGLWSLTYDEGVWYNNGKSLQHYPILKDGAAVLLASMYQDRQGIWWVGTQENGLYQFDGKAFIPYTFL